MTVDQIREQLNAYVGKPITIKYNLGRNKFEKYKVKITELYDYVFLVELNQQENTVVKSFSYSDVITKTIKIDYEK